MQADDDAPPPSGRTEGSHVEFPGATWTSFDRYARYGAIVRTIRASLGDGALTVLDVGDGSGYLRAFDDGLRSVSVDLAVSGDPLPGATLMVGDGTSLPAADASVDVVVSSDVLEHVPDRDRARFLAELARVARALVVVAAPFDTPGVAGAEELARRYAALAMGAPQEQLDEHAERGLPRLDDARDALERSGLTVAVRGNGNLHDWLLYMLVKHQIGARPALGPLEGAYDLSYNLLLAGRTDVAPYYRHLLAARRDDVPSFGTPLAPIEGTPADTTALVGAFLAANVSEASKQDTVPRLDGLAAEVAIVRGELGRLQAQLDALQAGVDGARSSLGALNEKVDGVVTTMDRVVELLRHPLRAVGRKVRPHRDG